MGATSFEWGRGRQDAGDGPGGGRTVNEEAGGPRVLEGPCGVLTLGWRVPRRGWATVEEEIRMARSPLGCSAASVFHVAVWPLSRGTPPAGGRSQGVRAVCSWGHARLWAASRWLGCSAGGGDGQQAEEPPGAASGQEARRQAASVRGRARPAGAARAALRDSSPPRLLQPSRRRPGVLWTVLSRVGLWFVGNHVRSPR